MIQWFRRWREDRADSIFRKSADELWERLETKQAALIAERNRLHDHNVEVRADRARWERLYEKACHDRDRYRAMVDQAAEVLCPCDDERVVRLKIIRLEEGDDVANGDE